MCPSFSDHANSCDVFSSTNQCRKRKKLGPIVGGGGGICQCHPLLSEPTAGVGDGWDGVNAKATLTKGSPPPQAHAWSPYLPLLYCTSFYIYLSIHPKYRIKLYINCNLLHCNSLVTGFPRWFSLPSPSLHWTAHQLKRILFQVRQRVSACPNWLKDHLRWPTCPEMPCRNVPVPKVQNLLWFDVIWFLWISQDLATVCAPVLGHSSFLLPPKGARQVSSQVRVGLGGELMERWGTGRWCRDLQMHISVYLWIVHACMCTSLFVCIYIYILLLLLYIIYIYISCMHVCVCQLKMQKIHRSFYLPMYIYIYIPL